jgi:uncharacterized repeat protein (TIGR01451 family)
VSNGGPDPALNVSLTDNLPAWVTFTSATPDQGSCSQAGSTVTCNLGNISSGSNANVVIVATAAEPGTLTNSAATSSDTLDLNPDNNNASEDTTVNPVPIPEADLSIAKSDGLDPVGAGGVLSYTLVITNNGPDAATAITVTDTLPLDGTYSAASGAGWDCVHAQADVTCTRPSLEIGVGPSIVVTMTAPVSGGTITNTVTVTSATTDPNPTDNQDAEQTAVQVQFFHYAYLPLVER